MPPVHSMPIPHLEVFGWSLSTVLQLPQARAPRTLQVVEVWSGVGAITGAATKQGIRSKGFDNKRRPGVAETEGKVLETEDILTQAGFQAVVFLVLSIQEGGLLWLAPVCNSWVWLSRSITKRSQENIMGDVSRKCVQDGNLHALVSALLLPDSIAPRDAGSCDHVFCV